MVLNYFHASNYILIMTPWESLQSNNGSLIIKQLPLIAFFILEYIYVNIYIYIYIKILMRKHKTVYKKQCKISVKCAKNVYRTIC